MENLLTRLPEAAQGTLRFAAVTRRPDLVPAGVALQTGVTLGKIPPVTRSAIVVLTLGCGLFAAVPGSAWGNSRDTASLGWSDAPLIEGCAAWLECRHHALHPAGDHMLFIGEVLASAHRNVPPLLWHGGRYRVGDAHKPRRTD